MELEEGEHIGDESVKNEVYMEADDGTKLDNSKEKSRESGKHRSKDRKGRREEKEIGIKERERSKPHDGVKEKDKELERHETREKDRILSRDRRMEGRDDHRKEHEKSGAKEKLRDKDYDDDNKHRERDRYRDRDEKDHDKDKERGRDHAKERERDRDREKEYSKSRVRDWELEKERTKEKNRDREKNRDGERNREKLPEGVKDKERKKERGKEHDRDREKEKDKDREKPDKDRYKEKNRDKDKHRERAREREADMLDEKNLHEGLEREMGKFKDGENDEKLKPDEVTDVPNKTKNADPYSEIRREGMKDTKKESSGSQPIAVDLEQRVLKMREERLKKSSDGVSEILSWVNKSRKLEDKMNAEKQKAQQLSKIFEEQDNIEEEESEDEDIANHTSKDLAGVKVLHGLDKVLEGGAVVLTLKDQNILADGDVNDEIDMLENVEIGEQKKRDEAYKAAKKKTGIYEDKFSDDPGAQRTILPQYDDPVEDEGVKLDESGRFTGEAEKKLEELRKRLQGASTSNRFEDLSSSAKSSSDYYTQEEMLQFRKPKKKKSLRKKSKLDLDALEAEAISAGLGVGDLGSRDNSKRQSAREEKERLEAEMRSSAYESALAKAEEASRALSMDQTLTVQQEEDENPVFGEDDEDLYKSLVKARKLALKKQEASLLGPQGIAQLAVANNQSGGSIQNENPTPGEEAQESKVIFSEVEEFVSSVGLLEENPKPETEDVFMVEADYPKSAEETKDKDGGWTEVKDSAMDELPVEEETEDVKADAIVDEPVVGKGLSGALMLLKERGTLKEGIDWGGRNMDKKKSKLVGINDGDDAKEIRIERLDEFGRVMTPKEAFRRISHKFHGKGPGKMKTEKRQKQYLEELKLKQMKASDTPSLSVERMRETQARLQTPYLVLSGHVKPGQTSDPRSGFATIEKDHHGSLTPMLGDQKVEHFLGIKRKAEPSNLCPPKKLKS